MSAPKKNIFTWKRNKKNIQPINLRGLNLNYSNRRTENRVRLWGSS